MARRLTSLALGATLALGAYACSGGSKDEIVVGEFASLTGGTATFGRSSDAGVQLAVAEINAAGGVEIKGDDGKPVKKKIRVVVEDDQSKPEEAPTAGFKH